MVYVYERADFSVSFQGFQVYPETIRKVLDRHPFSNYLTGKCVLEVDYDDNNRQVMYMHVEKKPDNPEDEQTDDALLKAIIEQLNKDNSEYRLNYTSNPEKVTPVIKLWPYENKVHFGGGGKQKWVK